MTIYTKKNLYPKSNKFLRVMVTRPARHHQAKDIREQAKLLLASVNNFSYLIINNLTFIAFINNEDIITSIILI